MESERRTRLRRGYGRARETAALAAVASAEAASCVAGVGRGVGLLSSERDALPPIARHGRERLFVCENSECVE